MIDAHGGEPGAHLLAILSAASFLFLVIGAGVGWMRTRRVGAEPRD
jgi:hypothetical protein